MTPILKQFPELEESPAGIRFTFDVPPVPLPDSHVLADWLKEIADSEGKTIARLEYIFCDDAALLEINRQFLNHDTLTDIITFPYAEDPIRAEIYISIERVRENATQFSEDVSRECCRVIAHGLLHMCGYGDKTAEQAAEMRQKESYYLGILEN